MKDEVLQAYRKIQAEKRAYGFLFGLLAAIGFSAALWGYDSYLLSQAHSDYPWMKFFIGCSMM